MNTLAIVTKTILHMQDSSKSKLKQSGFVSTESKVPRLPRFFQLMCCDNREMAYVSII